MIEFNSLRTYIGQLRIRGQAKRYIAQGGFFRRAAFFFIELSVIIDLLGIFILIYFFLYLSYKHG
jgi:hypothetical protein